MAWTMRKDTAGIDFIEIFVAYLWIWVALYPLKS
jgi:hypothetical protein